MGIRRHLQLARPTKVLFLFSFLTQFIATFYVAFQTDPPWAYELLSPFAFLWVIWWWLQEDSKRTDVRWQEMDLGLFLSIAWFVLVPYHLFKTRGVNAFLG